MRIAGIDRQSVVNAPGINFCIWTQGCPHHCEGCFNQSTWDYSKGYELNITELYNDIEQEISKCPLVTGVTFSGGEPLDQIWDVLNLACLLKTRLKLNVSLYTGYYLVFDELTDKCYIYRDPDDANSLANTVYIKQLRHVDNIFDGRFEINKRSYNTPFRGSSNQRWLKRGENYLKGGSSKCR